MRVINLRQSESTKPTRSTNIPSSNPKQLKNSKIRASSNPRLTSTGLNSSSVSNFKANKGHLISSSKIGKNMISDQSSRLLEQKERIK